jgi:putative ABC transport system permease protein
MRPLLQDLRYAGRLLARSPGFTLLTALTLALGIGGSAGIFSVVDSVLLRPLDYQDSGRLMFIHSQFPVLQSPRFWVSSPEYFEFRRLNHSFENVGAYATGEVNVAGRETPARVSAVGVTATLLQTLGVRPQLGDLIAPEQDRPGAEPVALLGDGLWRRAFGADRGIVGRRIQVDGQTCTVVGVMPPGFDVGQQKAELFMPLAFDPANPGPRGGHYLFMIGRLKQGVTLEQARADLEGMLQRWGDEVKEKHVPNTTTHRYVILPLLEDTVGNTRPALRILAGAVALLLIIACANVANLLLARAEARQKEIAVRTALGAGRGRLLRQFLTESVVLSLLGGLAGLALAYWGVKLLVATNPDAIPRVGEVGLDGRVLLFTLAVSLLTGLLFGLAPALHARAGTFFASLKEGGQRSTANSARQLLRRTLVVVEVALAAALVIAGGLLIRSFLALQHVDPGFEPEGVLTFQVSLPEAVYKEPTQITSFYQRLLDRLQSLPGVETAAAMDGLPPRRDASRNDTVFEGLPETEEGPPHNVDYWMFATPGYLDVMKIRLVSGRWFTPADTAGAAPVAVINEAMAKVFWPGRNPIGQRVRHPFDGMPFMTIVGIVADVKQGGLDQPAGTELYFSYPQSPETAGGAPNSMNVIVRTSKDPRSLAPAVRKAVHDLDPALPVSKLRPLNDVLYESVAGPRFLTLLVGLFAAIALTLAAVGTYGVLSYAVEQRTQEIGVRMALGAQPGKVLGMILSQGGRLVALGLGLGIALALGLRQVFASVLYGVQATDLLTLASVVLILAAVAFVACYVPARRATRVDPLMALRRE